MARNPGLNDCNPFRIASVSGSALRRSGRKCKAVASKSPNSSGGHLQFQLDWRWALLFRKAVNFEFLPAIERAEGAAPRVTTSVTRRHTISSNYTALIGFEVLPVQANPLTGGIVGIVVEEGGDCGFELGIVGNLHDDIVHNLKVTMVVPNCDGVDGE